MGGMRACEGPYSAKRDSEIPELFNLGVSNDYWIVRLKTAVIGCGFKDCLMRFVRRVDRLHTQRSVWAQQTNETCILGIYRSDHETYHGDAIVHFVAQF